MSAVAVAKQERTYLGINGKSAATSGAEIGNSPAGELAKAMGRAQRYELQAEARRLLPEYKALGECHRNVHYRESAPGVDIRLNMETGKAHFTNVVTCHSVWACPICAHKITEERRAELQAAINAHAMNGGRVALLTLTFPHEWHSPLADLLKDFSSALSSFWSYRSTKNILEQAGWIGSVRAMEVTHGRNGWHPHVHVLLFIGQAESDALAVLEHFRDWWGKAVAKAGLGQVNEHGFDVRGGDKAADYVAKYGHEPQETGWTVAHELTKTPVKQARAKDSRTPFGLLRDSMKGDAEAGAAFVEYVNAFKGKRQLFWSPKLREKLGLAQERTDEEIAADADANVPAMETVGTLNKQQWRTVLEYNARGQVLIMAERHGWNGVLWLLEDLRRRPPREVGDFSFVAVLMRGGKPAERLQLAA